MALVQLLINMNYSRRIIGFLRVNYYVLDILTLEPTQPDPTQPDPWMDPTHVQLCVYRIKYAYIQGRYVL